MQVKKIELRDFRCYSEVSPIAFALWGDLPAQRRHQYLDAHDIVDHFDGKIKLRLAYKIMDQCQPVRAGGKRLITAESFGAYLRQGEAVDPQERRERPPKREPTIGLKRGKRKQGDGYEFFRPPRSS